MHKVYLYVPYERSHARVRRYTARKNILCADIGGEQLLILHILPEDLAKLAELARSRSVRTASRARIILFLAQNPQANVEDAAHEEGESRGFAQYAVEKFKNFGAAGLVEKVKIFTPQEARGEPSCKARERGAEYLCEDCRSAPDSYALRGKCTRCKWGRAQIEFRCNHCVHVGWIMAGPMTHHLRRAHGLTREAALALLDAAKEGMHAATNSV